MTRLLLALLALALVTAFAPPAPAQAAWHGSCLVPGVHERCTVWKGEVTYVGDGDTVYVDVAGDGTRTAQHVRMTGINAMEQSVYSRTASRRRGDCHALEATAHLETLIRRSRWRVRLIAQDPSSHSGRRPRRVLAVKLRGRWRDAGRKLVKLGHALWLPNRREWLWNRDYSRLAQHAAERRIGIWNSSYCGTAHSEGAALEVWVNSDADGRDGSNVNGEWIKVRNPDPVNPVPLAGWWLRDSDLRRYTFRPWEVLNPGETVTVRVGEGADRWPELFWGLRGPAFDNASDGPLQLGDGVYLFDPEGDLRAWQQYPCRVNCEHPIAGAVEISARARGREHIELRNVSHGPIDLGPYRVVSKPYSYAFAGDAVLHPGETMRIAVEGDPATDTRLEKAWGETGPILNNRGDIVELKTFTEIRLGCYAYGDRSC